MRAPLLLALLPCACALFQSPGAQKPSKAPKTKPAPEPQKTPEWTAIVAKTREAGRPFRYFVVDIQRSIGALAVRT